MSLQFNNNPSYEDSVEDLNRILSQVKMQAKDDESPRIPVILKLGHSRSGSTLFTQWVASLGVFSYPSNFLSLFYKSPSIGARIYELLTNDDYTYNQEFNDLKKEIDFTSISGKTVGLKSPNEFWKFWLEHFSFPYTPVSEDQFMKTANFDTFNREIELLNKVFKRPFMLKAHNLNYYLDLFASRMNNAIYVHMYRDPVQVINSVIKGRVLRWGDINHWFGWKPREFDILKDMDVYHQVAGQVYFNEKAILDRRDSLGERYICFSYEDFCNKPKEIFTMITDLVDIFSSKPIKKSYKGKNSFKPSNRIIDSELANIEKAFEYFTKKYGNLRY